jgi:KipI family sensor histidine kinase inhibitor
VGDAAATVEFGDRLDPATNARVLALDRDLARSPFDGLCETVPAHRSLLVLYDPRAARFAAVRRELLTRAAKASAGPPVGRRHEIPTAYGGAHGPDLAELARSCGISEADVRSLHCSREYTAFMLGFTPGFAYLGLLPEALDTPRRPTPRVRVPAGSVAVAGRLTAVYPVASPGGWRLVGRTSVCLFDPRRAEPALLASGDRVRFRPVADLPPPELAQPAPRSEGPAAIEVHEAGLLTTVQGAARAGHRRFGVSGAGPLDVAAHAAANRTVGNLEGAAGLECTVVGPSLSFLTAVRFAVAGADLGAVLERADLGPWPVPLGAAVLARPGNVLRFAGRRSGCRAYVAFAGGIDVPAVLGSRACDLQGGFGGFEGRALARGDRLALDTAGDDAIGHDRRPAHCGSSATVRVVLGPQEDQLEPEAVSRFLATAWRVGSTSDRVGCRLEGLPLRHRGAGEILSDGMVPGSIQVPPDGLPIVMMADGPTTGGYPKIATVVEGDLPRLAQLVPGEGELRFEAVTVEEAQA